MGIHNSANQFKEGITMISYHQTLKSSSLELNNTQIEQSYAYSRTTVIQMRIRHERKRFYPLPEEMSDKQFAKLLFPSALEILGCKILNYYTSIKKCRNAALHSICCGWNTANYAKQTARAHSS